LGRIPEVAIRGSHWAALAGILLAGGALGFFGIGARLPGTERAGRVLTAEELRELSGPMREARDEVYRAYKTPGTIFDDTFVRRTEETVRVRLSGRDTEVPKTLLDSLRSYFLQPGYADDAVILRALSNIDPRRLEFDPRYYQYGGLYLYGAGAAIQTGGTLGLYRIRRDVAHYFAHPDELGRLYAMPRVLGTLFSLLGAAVLFLIGVRFCGSARTGLIAAFFLAFSPVVTALNHTMKPHTFILPFVLLSVYFALRTLADPRLRNYLWSGAFAGLGAGAIFFGGFSFFTLLSAHAGREWKARGLWCFADRRLAAAAAAAAACLFLVSPYQFLSIGSVIADAKLQASGDMSWANLLANLPGDYLIRYPRALGWGLWLLVTGSAAWALPRGDRLDRILLGGAAPLYLFVCLIQGAERYSMAAYPLLILVGARACSRLLDSRFRAWAALGLLLAGLYTAGYGLYYSALVARGDPRPRAGDWIRDHIAPGSLIAHGERLAYGAGGYPAFRLLDYRFARWTPGGAPDADFYLAIGEDGGEGSFPAAGEPRYRLAAAFRRDFGLADRIYSNHLLTLLDRPVLVYEKRPAR